MSLLSLAYNLLLLYDASRVQVMASPLGDNLHPGLRMFQHSIRVENSSLRQVWI